METPAARATSRSLTRIEEILGTTPQVRFVMRSWEPISAYDFRKRLQKADTLHYEL
jgi:hypothetical protein